jgi:hypothetical protein
VTNNLPEVIAALKRWEIRMDKAGELAARDIGRAVLTDAKAIAHSTVNTPIQKGGRLRHRPHIGPRDGEGPNYATGNLFRNILAEPVRREGFATYVAVVSSKAEYARAVEEGSSRWTSGVKFPYMRPARDRVVNLGKARMIMRGYYNAAMRG